MFTGLIESLAEVRRVDPGNGIMRLTLSVGGFEDTVAGDSVACNGVCLTVTERHGAELVFEVMSETASATLIPRYRPGRKVNVERALAAGQRMHGHIVQGHVDTVARVARIREKGRERVIEFSQPSRYDELIVRKGSVAVDGISLTVKDCSSGAFSVGVIPHTLSNTSLSALAAGDEVHIEYDIIGKYVTKALKMHGEGGGSDLEEVLKKW